MSLNTTRPKQNIDITGSIEMYVKAAEEHVPHAVALPLSVILYAVFVSFDYFFPVFQGRYHVQTARDLAGHLARLLSYL
ncbi:hypothetical protein GY45DRAFT_250737 [Cubamyces sp. BRFM 1775]|nr:hypothetical protein GY45DRAFT_250737 [Cubamyces sp. BRFM 1775]